MYDAYSGFALIYEELMSDTPYGTWASNIESLMQKYNITKESEEAELEEERKLVVDLGCGTGSFTRIMKERGYDMVGIDLSPEMLQIARVHEYDKPEEERILYLCQDMRELELFCTAGTIVSVCDSINYILEPSELVDVFGLVNNYLFPEGLFIFDFNTRHKYRDVIGDSVIAENRDEVSFIWENYYDEESDINEYEVTFFVQNDEKNETYKKFIETHLQRGYDVDEMVRYVEEAGLKVLECLDAETMQQATDKTERAYIVAREQGKKDK